MTTPRPLAYLRDPGRSAPRGLCPRHYRVGGGPCPPPMGYRWPTITRKYLEFLDRIFT